jgi:hypothetical protein
MIDNYLFEPIKGRGSVVGYRPGHFQGADKEVKGAAGKKHFPPAISYHEAMTMLIEVDRQTTIAVKRLTKEQFDSYLQMRLTAIYGDGAENQFKGVMTGKYNSLARLASDNIGRWHVLLELDRIEKEKASENKKAGGKGA